MRRLLLGLSCAVLASAAGTAFTPGSMAATTSGGVLRPASGSTSALEHSSNWSGVAVTGGSYTRVTGSWTVPTAKATSGNRYAATWVGIGGYSSSDLIQAGTAEEYAGGHATYYAWTEILPAPEAQISSFPVHPGDSMTVDINETSTATWTITVTDHSTGQTFTSNPHYASTNSSAEWIHEAPTVGGNQSRLASTTIVKFDNGTVNGSTPIGSGGTQHFIQLNGPTNATPSKLDADSNGFAVADGKTAPAPPAS